ncbi:MAG: VIT1/CCC1 transporter family protein [Chthonomonadales bacterium]
MPEEPLGGDMDRRLHRALRIARDRELYAARLYRMLGDQQPDERRRELFHKLAAAEEDHARRFEERLEAMGVNVSEATPGPGLLDRMVIRYLGTDAALRRMEAAEERNIAFFSRQSDVIREDSETHRLFLEVEAEEQAHARLLQTMAPAVTPHSQLEAMLKREKWHVSTGSWIGDAIYGVNDGLGAVFGIVSGMAGYTGGSHQVVVAGLFGMLASALSMGSGAYLATKSEREVYEAELARERREIHEDPEHESEELALIYQIKGFTKEEAEHMARTIAAQPDLFLKTMASEELGLSERHFPNPWVALASATISTALGAAIPVLPFFFASGMPAVIASAVISTLAHFAVGAAKSLVTARSWVASGTEMTVVGVLEAAITYGLGLLFHPPGGVT